MASAFRRGRVWFIVWPLVWTVIGLGAVGWSFRNRQEGAAPPPQHSERLDEGPWGHVEITPVVLEPPLRSVGTGDCTAARAEWKFHGKSRAQVDALLSEAGVEPAWRERLLSFAQCTADGCTVVPDDETVLGLTPARRRTLYAALAPFPDNVEQYSALSLPVARQDLWLHDADLGPEATELIRKLMWREDDVVRFGDVRLVCRSLPPARRPRLQQVLGRHPAATLTLVVPHDADVNTLAGWWENGSSPGVLRPLLEALARLPHGGRVDVSELLPRVARARLNRFPEADEDGRDCHWTALNFTNRRSNDRFLKSEEITHALEKEYVEIPREEAKFGDLLLFSDGIKAIHSASVVAADVFYTKNGRSTTAPWQFMRYADLRVLYRGETHFMRRRPEALVSGK